MEQEEQNLDLITEEKKLKMARIFAPLAIIIVLFGIWTFKKQEEQSKLEEIQAISDDINLQLITTFIDLDVLESYNMPIFLDFGADACVPCKEMEPLLVEYNEKLQGKAIIKFVDVWKNPEASQGFPVRVIPTQVVYNADGSPYVPSEDIMINFLLYYDKETEEHLFTVHEGGLIATEMDMIFKDMGVT